LARVRSVLRKLALQPDGSKAGRRGQPQSLAAGSEDG